jgi:hypothetical protein
MSGEFELAGFSESEVVVEHLAEGHLYVFRIGEAGAGRRIIDDGSCQSGASSKSSAQYFLLNARRFAENAARELDLIGPTN